MMNQKEVLLIIPAYNEEGQIGNVLDGLNQPEISSICDVLVVNDASKDATKYIARAKGAVVISNVFNLGYGSGLQSGYKYAARRKYKYVIQMDSDGQHDTKNVLKIYEALKSADEKGNTPDIVIGSRFIEGAVSFPVPFTKKIAFNLFRGLIKLATGKKIMDPTSGLQGLSRRTFIYYSKYSYFDDKYPDANMLMQMLILGYSVKEIPAIMYSRSDGESMHSGIIKPAIYMIRMTASIIAVYIRVKLLKIDKGALDALEYEEDL